MSKSKWSKHDAKITELIQDYESNSEIAKIILNTSLGAKKSKEVDLLRTYVKRFRNRQNEPNFETETETKGYQPKGKIFTAVASDGKIMDIETYCKFWGLDFDKVRSFKLVTHTGIPFYNIAFYETETEKHLNIDFDAIFKDKVNPIKYESNYFGINNALFDRLVYTDVHIGMNCNPDGYSLYGGTWNEEQLNNRLTEMVQYVLDKKQSNALHIHELGDFMDGWDAETVRKGHELPQNMDNQKAFDVGFNFKVKLVESLAPFYNEIICVNICDDNHAGSFGYVVNQAFKSFIELRYPAKVKVTNQRKFIDHYQVENRTFILTHGKDGKNLKFGFKPILDTKQVEKISNYIDEHYLKTKDSKIEFCKGDSHQDIFDCSTAQSFEYLNFPAFSPSSNWVQTNFKKGKSGFYMFNYYKDSKTIHPYVFKWQ
jgi:hypothetical protein